MRILMVNKFFYIKGGSETYYFSLKNLLKEHGHTVIDFSMTDPQNFPSEYSRYFVDRVDYADLPGIEKKLRAATHIVYSREAKKKFEQLVVDTKPDLVHLHIFQHQLSPSILDVVKAYNLPTVYTAHDLKMLCLNYKMMHQGQICEECKGGKYYRCVVNQCVKDSFAKSCINMVEGYVHRWHHSYDAIDKIITPSAFYKKKFEEFGIDAKRLVHIPNFLEAEQPVIKKDENTEKYYLYFGRLSEEKGILTLLKAFQIIGANLWIVGTGPVEKLVKDFVETNRMKHVKLLGFLSGQSLKNAVGNAKAVILPSEWYENGPYSAIEALQMHRPIIGADIGGIPELIDKNGFLFESGNPLDLSKKIKMMEVMNRTDYEVFKDNSYQLFLKSYTKQTHYPQLEKVYQEACLKH